MPTINLMNDSSTFAETQVNATTVGALRSELSLGGATINVNRTVAGDDHPIEDDNNVAVVSRDKKGGNKPTGMKKRSRNSKSRPVDPTMKNNILLDIEAGMPVSLAAKEYGVHGSTIRNWMRAGNRSHTKLRTSAILSTTKINSNGSLVTPVDSRTEFQPRVKEVRIHLSGTHVPQKGQLRVTRELLNYLNEVGAHLTK